MKFISHVFITDRIVDFIDEILIGFFFLSLIFLQKYNRFYRASFSCKDYSNIKPQNSLVNI
jgi:hypothetical protein